MDGAESKPLTESNAREIVKQYRKGPEINREQFGLTPREVIQWEDVLRRSTSVATRAAVMSAALQSAPYVLSIAKKAWETGEISGKDFVPMGQAIPKTLLTSRLTAGMTSAIVTSARTGSLGVVLQRIDPTFVAAGVTLGISAMSTSINAIQGDISWPHAAKAVCEDSLILASAMGGAALGQVLIPVPMLGALIGNLVGGAMGRLVIDQAGKVVMGHAVETGWTVFGLVEQDYTVPAHILKASGWQTMDIQWFEPQRPDIQWFRPEAPKIDWFKLNGVDMTVLRRGVVSFGRVGYVG